MLQTIVALHLFAQNLTTGVKDRLEREDGAAMVEYALLVVGIAVVVGAAALALGGRISALFNTVIP